MKAVKCKEGCAWPPRNKMDKSCKGPKSWHGGGENSPGTSRSGQKAGMLSSKPQLGKGRAVKPERPKEDKKTRAEKKSAKLNRFANPRFL